MATSYAKEVKKKLIEEDKTQAWLIDEVKKKTGLYCDSSLISRIFTGKLPGKKIVNAINEILQMEA